MFRMNFYIKNCSIYGKNIEKLMKRFLMSGKNEIVETVCVPSIIVGSLYSMFK